MISRRRFLRSGTVVSASAVAFPNIGKSAEWVQRRPGQRPRHIIQLVADGTSMGTLTCGEYFSQLMRRRGLSWMSLYRNPAAKFGWMNMRSLNSMVTDSSAASSSWGSGSRTINGLVNMLPDGTPLTTLYELLGHQGWKRGLVTTTEITHATPAGFAACVDDRDTGSLIASQYLDRGVDLMLGGGQKFFDPKSRKDKRNLKDDFRRAGYLVMETATELERASYEQRWLGLFSSSHLPYTIDRLADPKLSARVPTLARMTQAALDWLQRYDHFILQIEGGRVDHACHNCDAPSALHELLAFDEAIDVCLAFQRKHPDTLVVITTDHGNGNMGANGTGSAYGQSSWLFQHIASVNCSFPEIIRRLKNQKEVVDDTDDKKDPDAEGFNAAQDEKSKEDSASENKVAAVADEASSSSDNRRPRRERPRTVIATPAQAVQVIEDCTGYKPSERRAALLLPYLQKKGTPLYEAMNSDMAQLGQLIGNRIGIGWTGTAHTADFVPILALGPGAERFSGYIQNTDVFRHYTSMAGIDFRNPEEPLIVNAGPDASGVERIAEYALV